jgi:hypothetical protein
VGSGSSAFTSGKAAVTPGFGIRYLSPVGPIVETIGIVERMPSLVSQIAHRFLGVLDRRGIILFDPREARVRQIEWNPDEGRSIGTPPLVAQIDRRPELETLCGDLLIELADQLLEQRSAYLQTNVGYTLRQKRVTLAFPVGSRLFHDEDSGKHRTLLAPAGSLQ